MNVPRAIELALYAGLRKTAQVGGNTVIRCWQNLSTDPQWKKESDRKYPSITLLAQPPVNDTDGGEAFRVTVSLLCATHAADDRDHTAVSAMYGEVQAYVDKLLGQFRGRVEGEEFIDFAAAVQAECGEDFDGIGGLLMADGIAQYTEDKAYIMGPSLVIAYSRKDI